MSLLEGLPGKVWSLVEEATWQNIEEAYQATEQPNRPWNWDLFSSCSTLRTHRERQLTGMTQPRRLSGACRIP
jgi:hypothetical protein